MFLDSIFLQLFSNRTEHEVVAKNFQEKVEQLMSDLDAANDKLAEAYASPEMLESSPMRSVSAMSDYDSSNVHALNKDYRRLVVSVGGPVRQRGYRT